ncbi:MAG: hypothetical protein AAGA87_00065 [Pseudomonadota bacterium]
MPQGTTITLPDDQWTELTNDNATTVTVQSLSAWPVQVKGSVNATPPTDDLGALELSPNIGIINQTLQDVFPGSGFTRLFAKGRSGARVVIWHA